MATLRKTLLSLLSLFALAGATFAGNLDPPAKPSDQGSAMYSANDLYYRLTIGATGTKRIGPFAEPIAAPGPTGHTSNEIMAAMPEEDNTDGATIAEVLVGKTFWGLRTKGPLGPAWGLKVGTVPVGSNVSGGNGQKTFVIPDGFYSGSKMATANDVNLIPGNVRSETGLTIFGVSGDPGVVNTISGNATATDILVNKIAWVKGVEVTGVRNPAPVARTGQTSCFKGQWTNACTDTGTDGDLKKGVASPTDRFIDNNNGTVTDALTGLIWLKNADCSILLVTGLNLAISTAYGLQNGDCGLSDGSSAKQWRLPNVKELQSIIDFGMTKPALPLNNHFIMPTSYSDSWWTSTYNLSRTDGSSAYIVNLTNGTVNPSLGVTNTNHVWPVSGGL